MTLMGDNDLKTTMRYIRASAVSEAGKANKLTTANLR